MQMSEAKPFLFKAGPQAICLLHAFGGSSNDVRLLGHQLNKEGYTVYAPVFTGHGGDPKEIFQRGSAATWSRDAHWSLTYLRDSGYTPVAAFGLSMGGLFATELLETEPGLKAGGTFSSPVVSFGHNSVAEGFPSMVAGYCDANGMTAEQKNAELANIEPALSNCLKDLDNYVADHIANNLSRIKVPFFIAQGGADEVIDPKSGEKLRDRLEQLGKKVDFHFYPKASHVLTVNAAHRQLTADVKNYLKQTIGENYD